MPDQGKQVEEVILSETKAREIIKVETADGTVYTIEMTAASARARVTGGPYLSNRQDCYIESYQDDQRARPIIRVGWCIRFKRVRARDIPTAEVTSITRF